MASSRFVQAISSMNASSFSWRIRWQIILGFSPTDSAKAGIKRISLLLAQARSNSFRSFDDNMGLDRIRNIAVLVRTMMHVGDLFGGRGVADPFDLRVKRDLCEPLPAVFQRGHFAD